ncbi:Hypothetical predicted protein [Olea europaea subsp. europaea]|uniref:DUF1985 domain-containing protein n=1 Tax=Olea europaea subsp. europaea TaxID=158383 RepID=A0A8S0V2S2_OLEEU|nr:Hypothetical predicted protein [Olea europaea subsp. europaea]
MDFEFLIPEDARLRTHISQRSNLKYVKTVMDHFDERQCEDFCNSPLGYLANIPDIQFSAQLILQLLFRTVRTEKVNELWFNVQGHLMKFGPQEYAAVTGLRCSLFPKGDDFDQLIERKRLKERYRRLLHGLRGSFARKFQKAKRRKEKEITCTVHDFPIAMQIHSLHDESRVSGQSGGQDLDDRVRSGRSGDGETSRDDESDGESGSDREGDDSEDTGDSSTPPATPVRSPVRGCTTNSRSVRTSAFILTKGKVEELLLDQRILFEMRLQIVKFEIEQHVIFECTRLPEFIAAQVAPHLPTTALRSTAPFSSSVLHVVPHKTYMDEAQTHCPLQLKWELTQDVHSLQTEHTVLHARTRGSCLSKLKTCQRADIAPCPDAEHEPLSTPIDDQEEGAATEPSDVAAVRDAEIDGCNVTDGEGIVATVPVPAVDVPVPAPVPEEGGRVSTTRRYSTRP